VLFKSAYPSEFIHFKIANNSRFRKIISLQFSVQSVITCKRIGAKYSIKDDFTILWEHATFRHPLNENPFTGRSEILHS
jgi:hypothetical protein